VKARKLRAGVIGLGMIGGGIAVSLAKSGMVPTVYDIRKDAAETLEGVPSCVSSPLEVARQSDVVMVCVVNDAQAYAVLEGDQGLLAGAHDNLTVCMISTMSLGNVRKMHELCSSYGVSFMDCGVTPGNLAATHGMIAMVGADEDVASFAEPVIKGWAKNMIHCGPIGAGMATKLARNIVTYAKGIMEAKKDYMEK